MESIVENFRRGKLTLDARKIRKIKLSGKEEEVLRLLKDGSSPVRVAWILDTSVKEVDAVCRSIEIALGTDRFAEAGTIYFFDPERDETPTTELLRTSLSCLRGAMIISPVQDGDFCGFSVLLNTGQVLNAWLYSTNSTEEPGWISLENVAAEGSDPESFDVAQLEHLRNEIEAVLDGEYDTEQAIVDALKTVATKTRRLLKELGHCGVRTASKAPAYPVASAFSFTPGSADFRTSFGANRSAVEKDATGAFSRPLRPMLNDLPNQAVNSPGQQPFVNDDQDRFELAEDGGFEECAAVFLHDTAFSLVVVELSA
jgi:DNA-binding CsgD family transcriptional regulator